MKRLKSTVYDVHVAQLRFRAFLLLVNPNKKQKVTSPVTSQHTHRHSFEQFVHIPCSFCELHACDAILSKWWIYKVRHCFGSTQTPFCGPFQ